MHKRILKQRKEKNGRTQDGRGLTCDFKPHGDIGGLGGNDAHHVGHRVTLHDGEAEGRLLEEQRRRVGRQLRFRDPLDVQAAGGGFLRTPVVDGFDLGKRGAQ